MKVRMIEVLN